VPDLDVPVLVALAAVGYGVGVRRARATGAPAPSPRQVAAFALGLVAVAAGLGPPMEGAATTSLTAHMTQHVVLLVVAAPLLVMGMPGAALGGLVPRLRSIVPVPSPLGAAWVGAAVVVQAAAMWAWHAPPLFDAAVLHEPLHALEHACLLGTAMLFWWTLLRMGGGARLGTGVLAVFAAALAGTALGAAMTLATKPWYPPYVGASRSDALTDQQVAGVVMWAFAGLAYVVTAAILFFTWLAQGEQSPVGRGGEPRQPRPVGTPA
jgi:cytochrome c oxidase assembly factor CtaG